MYQRSGKLECHRMEEERSMAVNAQQRKKASLRLPLICQQAEQLCQKVDGLASSVQGI